MFRKKAELPVRLNGAPPNSATIRAVVSALQSREILTEKGGYIFKAALCIPTLHIHIRPAIIEGVRSMHYNMEIEAEDPIYLSGSFNANGSLMLFPLPPGKPALTLTPEQQLHAKELIVRFASCMLKWGISPSLPLDIPTNQIMTELNITPSPPETLGGLRELLTTEAL